MNTRIADISHVNNIKYFGYIYDYRINIVIYLNILENNNYCKPLVSNCVVVLLLEVVYSIITWLVDICTQIYCLQSAISECNMKHVECNMKHSLCEAKIDKPCNKLVITWLFRAIWYIFFSILYIALALRARAI